jgi:hypothetical protein
LKREFKLRIEEAARKQAHQRTGYCVGVNKYSPRRSFANFRCGQPNGTANSNWSNWTIKKQSRDSEKSTKSLDKLILCAKTGRELTGISWMQQRNRTHC